MEESLGKEALGKWILITGDVNAGKTTLTRNIMEGLCSLGLSSRIVIVDMAPEIPEEIASRRGLKGVGGRLVPGTWKDILRLAGRLRPPRLTAQTEEEAATIALENRQELDGLFREFRRAGRDILIVNDVSIYLQAGDAGHLLEWMGDTTTVVANGYYGRKLGAGSLSLREAREMEKLIRSFPCHIGMPHPAPEKLLGGGTDEGRKL